MEKKFDIKKLLNIIKSIFVWLLVAFSAFMMIFTLVSVNTLDHNDRNIFGFKFFVVQTDSMAATDFDAGDIIISKEVDITSLQVGDIITFISQSSHNYGETVTHKIREIVRESDGSLGFVTYGTTTDTNDEALATIVVGKYVSRIPNLGAFFLFLKTTPGYIICILIPFLLLILSQGLNCIRLFRQYKKEQLAEMNAEREQLEQERAESQRLMAELLALKAQMENQNGGETPPAAPAAPAAPEESQTDASVAESADNKADET